MEMLGSGCPIVPDRVNGSPSISSWKSVSGSREGSTNFDPQMQLLLGTSTSGISTGIRPGV